MQAIQTLEGLDIYTNDRSFVTRDRFCYPLQATTVAISNLPVGKQVYDAGVLLHPIAKVLSYPQRLMTKIIVKACSRFFYDLDLF